MYLLYNYSKVYDRTISILEKYRFYMKREIKKIKVKIENIELNIEGYQGQNLLEILQENNISIPAVCQGSGTCGKCKIKLLSGNLPITETERKLLSEEEVTQGIRLACKAVIEKTKKEEKNSFEEIGDEDSLHIEVLEESEEIEVESVEIKLSQTEDKKIDRQQKTGEQEKENFFIAIDIGTTTIAMALVKEETGEICDIYTSLNHQRKYGTDVIGRITAANAGKAEELKRLIEEDLCQGICSLMKAGKKPKSKVSNSQDETIKFPREHERKNINISRIILAGNTTMIHLLMGYSCQSLGKYPFVSEHLGQVECTLKDVITTNRVDGRQKECIIADVNNNVEKDSIASLPVIILPAISAFVGGDIVAGILACPVFETEGISLLLDLGTNGEIVLGNKEKLLVTSTAAGPAFEGGNITCGTASIPGSIDRVKIQNQKAIVKTIKNQMPPIGICGTGLVSVIAQLLENKMIDEQGNLRYPYSENGFTLWVQNHGESIKLYQKDIREFQMAKSAIRAGVEILMQEYGCQVTDIKQIYLAGGFGTNLLADDVVVTGILPQEWKDKIIPIGNGALQGAVKVGMEKAECHKTMEGIQVIQNIRNRAKNISLAEHDSFQEMYLKHMDF